MLTTKYLRFVTYFLLGAALCVGGKMQRVIPVALSAGESERAEVAAFRENLGILHQKGFLDSTRSGQELFAIARKAATSSGRDLSHWEPPRVSIRTRDGRLFWVFTYYQLGRPPGGYFSISIDDASGRIIDHADGCEEPNQTPEPTPTAVTIPADAGLAPLAGVAHL